MKIVENSHQAYAHVDHWRREGLRIGLVPTMGALHEGHFSLVRRSVDECDVTVATIFVNPTQFGPGEDLDRYPRTLDMDLAGLRGLGTSLVFVPKPEQMYPEGFSTYVSPPAVAQKLEGEHRPDHFRGVTTVVLKLFNLIPATIAYFGQKDYQQLTVIRRMVEDLNVPVRIQGCETIRESDGLALSSRNRYLSPTQREAAVSLWKALSAARELVGGGSKNVAEIEDAMRRILVASGADPIEYARIVDRQSLEDMATIDRPAIALIAARIGETRLIDNLLLDAD